MKQKKSRILILIVLSVLILWPASHAAPVADHPVVNTNNAGDGSLRQAMLDANAAGGGNIVFSIPTDDPGYNAGTDVWTIQPLIALPTLSSGGTTIDGYSQPGAAVGTDLTRPKLVIAIDGTNVAGQNGFNINSAANVITGLSINRFGWSGIAILGTNAMSNTIAGNYIYYNVHDGVSILLGAQNNTIGGDTAAERNYIFDNNWDGISIHGANTTGNAVSRNLIGIGLLGEDVGNTGYGVRIYGGAHGNVIGGDTYAERNAISGNDLDGVRIAGANTRDNVVMGNSIGRFSVSSSGQGVTIIDGAHDNTIGPGNTISHNDENGVYIKGTSTMSNTISGNDIHNNTENGVYIYEAQNNTVGGDTESERNYIYSNEGNGVTSEAAIGTAIGNNMVSGNYIGIDASEAAQGNGGCGVELEFSLHNIIGGDTEGERNVISGNAQPGIHLWAAHDSIISGNYIGTDVDGIPTSGFGNGQDGIVSNVANDVVIGGDTLYERNIIAGNGTNGVWISGPRNLITRNSIYANAYIGISVFDPSSWIPAPPVIVSTDLGSSVEIVGTACPGCTVEVFENSDTDGEGETYVGDAIADAAGTFTVTVSALTKPYLTATATDDTNTTSLFSAVFESTIQSVFLPLVIRNYP